MFVRILNVFNCRYNFQKTNLGCVAYGKANFKNNRKTCGITCIDDTFMNIPKLWELKEFFRTKSC